ncbi:hypothetical protein IDM36_15235 [Enterobacter mori]|uniref:Glycine-rich domain-containing protein n=1 Tax=Enterobacter mori TaxID=539813 RepID=A0A7T0DTZ9_9ENTR|nr:hypothetical protein [Enterobacter mori]QPJ99267.1 hypothetical protein IDM36_15235 [Enterobacter mori]
MALTLLAANNAQTVLAAGINATATSLTVNSGTGALFPDPSAGVSFFKLTLIDSATGQLSEIVHVTARTGDTMTIARAQEGTTARAWSANDIAANMMTAGTLSYILGNFQPLDATLSALASLATGADKLPYFTGTDTAGQTDLTQVGRDIIGKSSIANVLSYLGLGDGTGRLINVQTFTASGTYTPTVGTKFVIAEVLGGGGGGGSNAATPSSGAAAGAGGASGAYAVCKHTPTGPVSIVIGAGGAGGVSTAAGADGSTGGTSSYGAVSAPGGRGGPRGVAFNTFPTGGNVATGSSGVTGSVIVGTPGTGGSYGILYSDSNATGGGGANSIYGAGGIAITINNGGSGTSQGADANGYGSGGGGAVSVHTATASSSRGGNGTSGIVIIWEYA